MRGWQWSDRVGWRCTLSTWVHLAVGADAVGVHNALEARGELGGLVVGGRRLLGLHAVEDGGNGGAALLLRRVGGGGQSHREFSSTVAILLSD